MFTLNQMKCHIKAHTHTQTHSVRGQRRSLTQQLGDVKQGLTTQEDLPVAARVAGETFLAAMFALLGLHKVSGDVVVFRDHGVAWKSESRAVRPVGVCVHDEDSDLLWSCVE